VMRVFSKSVQFGALLSLAVVMGCSASGGRTANHDVTDGVGTGPRGPTTLGTNSLTPPDYHGKKYYFGWGLNDNGNPEMDNEVEYDVLHTHDIFTKAIGGNYVGAKLIGEEVSSDAITSEWNGLKSKMKPEDMYLQYSSGHGYPGGLEAGVDYNDIINYTLSMPAKEIVIFTMACFSGGLVDAFNDAKDRWQDFASQGRTLFVMASSESYEESSTGPGTDQDEPNGPDGSAGSAFGHSLWKALIGYADQQSNGGNGDGFISLGEITKYVVEDTQNEGGHTPVFTGVYDANLKIAEKPSKAQVLELLRNDKNGAAKFQRLVADGIISAL